MSVSKKTLRFSALIITLSFIAALFFGCSAPSGTNSPVLIKNFECDMRVVSGRGNYLCRLRRTDESSVLTVKEPAELDGLELEYQGGVYSVSFKGLKMSLDDSKTQLTKHFADAIMKILDKTFSLEEISARQENGVWVYNGETSYGGFELRFDGDGKILSVRIPRIETEITMENFSEIK